MPINPNIALSFQAPQIDDPLNKMAQIEQIKAYRQNALAKQMEMESAIREREMTNALRQRLAKGGELGLEEAATFGAPGMDIYKTMASAKKESALFNKAQQDALMKKIELGSHQLKIIPNNQEAYSKTYKKIIETSPELADYLEPPEQFDPDPMSGTIARAVLNADTLRNNALEQDRFLTGLSVRKAEAVLKNAFTVDPVTGQSMIKPGADMPSVYQALDILRQSPRGGAQVPPPASDPALDQPVDMGAGAGGLPSGRLPPPGAPGMPPVTQVGSSIVTPEQNRELRERIKLEEATAAQKGKNIAKRLDEEPSVRTGVVENRNMVENTMRQIDDLFNSVGLKKVTGNFAGRWPELTAVGTFSQEAADANAAIESLKAKSFLSSIKSLGAGNSGLSPITDREGAKLEAAAATLQQSQGTEAFQKNLIAFKKQLIKSNNLIAKEYARIYGNLEIPDWSPVQPILPDASVAKLKNDPSVDNKKVFDSYYGEGMADYVLKGSF